MAYFRIQNSRDSIQEIAEEVGYENMSYFYRKFQDIYGIRPRALRNLAGPSTP